MKENLFKKWWQNYWPLVGYFLISVIFLYPILIQEGIPFKYDWSWPLFESGTFLKGLFAKEPFSLQLIFTKVAGMIIGALSLAFKSPSNLLKIFLLLIHITAGWAMYLLIYNHTKQKLVAFIAGLAYTFSPYIFIRTIVGFVYSLIAYACLPLFVHLFLKQEKKKILDFVLLSVLFVLVVAQIQAGLLLLLLLLIAILSEKSKIVIRLNKFFLIVIFSLLIVAPWAIWLLSSGSSGAIINGGQVTTLNYIANLPHSLRNVLFLSDHIITRDYFYSFAREPIVVVGFVVFYLVSLFSLFDKKNRPLIFSLIISSLLILPFSIGPTGIFTGFYIFVFNHFPLIAVFRETYHFQFLLSFNIIALFAFGLSYIFKNLSNKRPFFWLIKVIAASSIVIVIAPYLGFDYAGYFRLQEIPDEYRQADQFFQTNADYCKKAYYPPSMGFVRFSSDPTAETSASNSDIIAWDFGLPRVTDAASVLSIAGDEMYQRNHLTSQFLEFSDNGEFAALAKEQGVDCVIVRDDLTSLYFLANNVWRDPSFDVRLKWMNQDMLSLAESKKGLRLDKQFGDKIFLYKIETDKEFNTVGTIEKLPEGIKLPITDWANNFDWYTEGWARGRYNFWRKHLFAQLEQDFIYTNRPDSEVGGNIAESGSYDLIIRYLDGGDSGEFALRIQNKENRINKTTGEERFVVKNLGMIDVKKGDIITIKNISGENAIADLLLVRSKE